MTCLDYQCVSVTDHISHKRPNPLLYPILRNRPNIQLQKLIQMRRGGILVFVKDIHSLNSLLSPWPTGAFNGATIKCRLAQRGNQTTQDNRLTKQLIIKGIQMETTSEEIQQELERQRITKTKVYRIVSRNYTATDYFHPYSPQQPGRRAWPTARGILHELLPLQGGKSTATPHQH